MSEYKTVNLVCTLCDELYFINEIYYSNRINMVCLNCEINHIIKVLKNNDEIRLHTIKSLKADIKPIYYKKNEIDKIISNLRIRYPLNKISEEYVINKLIAETI